MNLYIHLETIARELDGKLLLALLGASRGHEVIISNLETISKGLEKNLLTPGIVHTKSLTPSRAKHEKHKKIINTGCKITSMDEEGGLVDYGYDRMAISRYGEKTLKQVSAVFTWGPEDFKSLKKYYPNYRTKFHMTGSSRVDLWSPKFLSYWEKKNKKLNKPFLLIPSNFGAGLAVLSLYERIKVRKVGEYFDRFPSLKKTFIKRESEQFKLIAYFLEAIEHLSNKNKNYHIILRPHPAESVETWKILLDQYPNVSVIRDDGVSSWIKDAFAILHNGCTTALEASLFKKPIITYTPFKAEFSRKLANDLGQKVTSLDELKKKIDGIFLNLKKIKKQKKINKPLPKILQKKLFIDEKEIAALKMIKVWESISGEKLSKSNNWFLFKSSLKIAKIFRMKNLFLNNPKNFKFPPFERKKVLLKIDELIKILKIKEELNCEFLSDRTLLIKKK